MITGTVIVTLINICQNVYDYVIYNHTLNITIFLDMQVLGLHSSLCMFLISLFGAPLARRASYLALHSSLFGPMVQLIMIILSLTALTLC